MQVIGRSRRADIRLRDESVSRLHAELVVAENDLLHVADRSSANGTWIHVDGRWKSVTQRIVTERDRLRFGAHEVAVSELLHRAPVQQAAGDARDGAGASGDDRGNTNELPDGPVRRNPETGEVIAD